jgi:hexosaminidase
MHAVIAADNFYGARNGLETLSQLIVYDNIRNEILIVGSVSIADEPKFKYRGFLLDTSRNFFSIESIKRTIEGMGMVKLNTFHWHITDSHSFPFVMKSQPELARLGAYSPEKVYTAEEIEDVVKFGKVRGVRVLPEFDAPAHVGEGWQKKDLTTCFNAQPWKDYCVEPPCGQLDPSKDEVYNVLEDIYREMVEHFKYPDLFHMGGDEVSVNCWNTSKSLQDWMINKGWNLTEADFMKLWGYFQDNALARLDKVNYQQVPVIVWTSRLTEEPFLTKYLDNKRYIIQIWTKGDDPKVQVLLENGYNIIVSNYDALYLDCGYGAWVTDGNNWCSPYIGWQKVYDNRMESFGMPYIDQIYGAEAALWSEQVDEWALDAKIWPRASALAERLWSSEY